MKQMSKEKKSKSLLRVWFILIVASILIIALAIVFVLEYFIIQLHLLPEEELRSSGIFYMILFCVTSILIGTGLAFLLGKFILDPMNKIIRGMEKLSSGDFTTRIDLGKNLWLKSIATGFNTLADELQNTEILRSDFVNNFSHEFKTPIVSINGLIGLMKNEDLPKEKMHKYLGIIEEEANRLAEMTTNMLNLSKIEKQEILTDCKKFNLSEQIRSSVLLLEKKWSKKRLKLDLDFDEHYVFANEDLLKQVWLNLIDNAVKFAHDKTPLIIKIEDSADKTTVSISDRGEVIEQKDIDKIFSKFYQAGEKKEGNGIGLSIVKHIVDLHDGEITVTSDGESTVFTVSLPKMQ